MMCPTMKANTLKQMKLTSMGKRSTMAMKSMISHKEEYEDLLHNDFQRADAPQRHRYSLSSIDIYFIEHISYVHI